jgi:hypothetical protein
MRAQATWTPTSSSCHHLYYCEYKEATWTATSSFYHHPFQHEYKRATVSFWEARIGS